MKQSEADSTNVPYLGGRSTGWWGLRLLVNTPSNRDASLVPMGRGCLRGPYRQNIVAASSCRKSSMVLRTMSGMRSHVCPRN